MTVHAPIPEPEVLIKKIRAKGHGGHHGGAWKVAYADFVTAMMAFFLLMWLLGSTDEKKRKGVADYFSATLIQTESSGGSSGVLGGRSLEEPEGAAPFAKRAGVQLLTPADRTEERRAEQAQLQAMESEIRKRLERDPALKSLQTKLRFSETPEGLRIELIDEADYSMFTSGTAMMDPRADKLLSIVADVIRTVPNKLAIRGHTDSAPFAVRRPGQPSNNWTLSSARAEATRQSLAAAGLPADRFSRLEGVADTDPINPADPFDPKNRRMSVTLLRN